MPKPLAVLLVLLVAAFAASRVIDLSPTPPPAVKAKVSAGKWAAYLAPTSRCPQRSTLSGQRTEMECLIDFARAQRGLASLKAAKELRASGRAKAKRILSCQDFSHQPCGDDFLSAFRRARYGTSARTWQAGENLGWGERDTGRPRAIMAAWLNSDGHRRNLLSAKWREQAVTVTRGALDDKRITLWVSHFGRR